jgi:hypothetical protein
MLTYLMFIIPGALLGIYAQMKIKSAYARASRVPAASGVSGAQAAAQILAVNGLQNVTIEQVPGHLSDHYDPKKKVLRLSQEVYHGRSLASLGIAAHEAGHAIQDAKNYGPLVIRNGIVPLASFGSNASFFILFIGALVGSLGLVLLGVGLFSLVVIFQLVNLPVEFDASSRAKETLLNNGLISTAEHGEVSSVLNAAALTYVAATVSAILTLLYYMWQMGLLGGHSRD